MAKIHTHYDNLKVARLAPPEVIRAAYKALSQKYHPDKNPGDEKAARIMAILNSAYGILSDPVRRREHDEWIAAEEWEIEWLESTREDGRDKARVEQWEPQEIEPAPAYRASRDPKWWFGLTLFFAIGCAAGIVLMSQQKLLPVALASVLGSPAPPVPVVAAERRPVAALDSWARARQHAPEPGAPEPEIQTLAVTQLVIPQRRPDCATELHSLVAPNGEPWPAQSGYLAGFPIGNEGSETELSIDNTRNNSAALIKVYDLERRSNVRHVFVLAHDKVLIEQLAVGKYEVRYQNIDVGATHEQCLRRTRAADGADRIDPSAAPQS